MGEELGKRERNAKHLGKGLTRGGNNPNLKESRRETVERTHHGGFVPMYVHREEELKWKKKGERWVIVMHFEVEKGKEKKGPV